MYTSRQHRWIFLNLFSSFSFNFFRYIITFTLYYIIQNKYLIYSKKAFKFCLNFVHPYLITTRELSSFESFSGGWMHDDEGSSATNERIVRQADEPIALQSPRGSTCLFLPSFPCLLHRVVSNDAVAYLILRSHFFVGSDRKMPCRSAIR